MTAEWLGYYNKERPHSALDYRSPEMYRKSAESPMAANFLARFFRSGAACGATRRALAAPSLRLRYKIAPKMD